MYSYEERTRAVQLYIKYGMSIATVIRELGYPSRQMLYEWYSEFKENGGLRKNNKRGSCKYSDGQRKCAVEYYLEHGKSVGGTIKALGFPRRTALRSWLKEDLPDSGNRCVVSKNLLRYTPEQKEQAVIRLCAGDGTVKEIATKFGVTGSSLYTWKKRLRNEGCCDPMPNQNASKRVEKPSGAREGQGDLIAEKEALTQQVEGLKREVHRLKMERDILEKAGEILKKGQGINLATLTNREKAVVIDALRSKYRLKELLPVLSIAKSSYCYQEQALQKPDKYSRLRSKIKHSFVAAHGRYGYRRIHAVLRKEGDCASEKVVRRIMREEQLTVPCTRKRKYSSYMGEISPEVENLIHRDFNANTPNTKWLTDITEFSISAGKVYLSPVVDCFDGLLVSWTIGTSPDANLVNTMLDVAVSTLGEGERPILHSDRGGHYRWPGWIDRMQEASLPRSMSKKGCSPDNAACEGFFGRVKTEMFYGRSWVGISIDGFISTLDEYLRWYNETRIKMSLGAMSPVEYRRSLGLIAQA